MKNNFKLYIFFIFIIIFFILPKPAFAIRIGLVTNAAYAQVAVSGSACFIDGYSGRNISGITPMQLYTVKSNGSGLIVALYGKTYNTGTNYIIIKQAGQGLIFAKNKWYRGNIIIFNTGAGVTVVNDINLEQYLMGVVPAEMPSRWNIEAHKAQAIAARSYAVANLGKRSRYGYDLKDTPEDQAYGGASAENIKTNNAVEQTAGQVLVCGNKVIPAYYHSSSGGYTLNAGSVWLKDLPFTRSVPSFDGNRPKSGHGVGMSQYGANFLANYGYNAYQILGYFYQNVKLYRLNNQI